MGAPPVAVLVSGLELHPTIERARIAIRNRLRCTLSFYQLWGFSAILNGVKLKNISA